MGAGEVRGHACARLKTDSNPLLFHINMDPAGHGGASGRYDRLREVAFDYAFVAWQLGIEGPAAKVEPIEVGAASQ